MRELEVLSDEQLSQALDTADLRSKKAVEQYHVRITSPNKSWGLFSVGENGYFHCHSDFGDYTYVWTSIGDQTIKEFLIGLANDPHYLLIKTVGKPKTYDHQGTMSEWAASIINYRKSKMITKTQARELYDALKSSAMDDVDMSPDLVMNYWINEVLPSVDNLRYIHSDEFSIRRVYSYHERFWATVLFPAFVKILKMERLNDPRYSQMKLPMFEEDKTQAE